VPVLSDLPAVRVLPCEVLHRPTFLGINISVDYKMVAVVIDPECREVDESALPAPCVLPAVNVPSRRSRVVMAPVVVGVSVESGLF
jgi:hypothetical protein